MKFRLARYILQAVAAAIALFCLPVEAFAQVNAEQVMNIGRNVLSMEDYMLAIQYFNQAIKAKPYLAEPYYLRALAKLNLEDYQGAVDDATLSIERNKFITEAFRLRGFCLQNLGRDSLAILDYNVGLRYAPEDKYFLFYKSVAQMQVNDTLGADSTFNRLLALYPKFDEAYTARARLRYLRGDTIGALADIDVSVASSDANINNYLMRADIYVNRKDWLNASKALDDIIRLDPKNADMYVNRAYLRYNIDNIGGALADYNYALELNPDNIAAVYNRALLHLEVRDLKGAYDDFSRVIAADPGNFHALYNRALIALDLKRWKQAIADFTAISKKYPRFYPIYYGIAQAREALGDRDGAVRMMLYAEDMVRKYVDNPRRNPLDRPAIQPGEFNDRGLEKDEKEDDIDVMERFNRLVTVPAEDDTKLTYSDKIKGRVQDRSLDVRLEPMFAISMIDGRTSLRPTANYFREIEEINLERLTPRTLYVTNTGAEALSEQQAADLFDVVANYNSSIASGNARPVDYLGRAVANTQLKNYEDALRDLDAAIALNDSFTAAWLARAFVRDAVSRLPQGNPVPVTAREVLADLDKALSLNPRLIYALYDKGNVLYSAGNYTEALQCYNTALDINPEFAEALYNRGLTYIALGNREKAFADLSRAGQLGVMQSYRVLKSVK